MQQEEYRFQGREGEKVPPTVQRLIINPGTQVLPYALCCDCDDLREVTICSTVESIGDSAFEGCELLVKVDFESSSSTSPHQLTRIGGYALNACSSLQRFTLPSSVNCIGQSSFYRCYALVEASLSTTSIARIPWLAFKDCWSLQSVGLPNTLEEIGFGSFQNCCRLVTVTVPLDSQPINLMGGSFDGCSALANLWLPEGSIANPRTDFRKCALLKDQFDRFGEGADKIVNGLVSRFKGFPVHRLCYDHSSTTVQELGQCLRKRKQDCKQAPVVDNFGMTPFHVLFSTVEPRQDLIEVLLDQYPYYVLGRKDANDKLAMDYLVSNWTRENKMLLQMTLQCWMDCRLARWGSKDWKRRMEPTMGALLAEDDKERRVTLYDEACSIMQEYENVEVMSILEEKLGVQDIPIIDFLGIRIIPSASSHYD